ncbi:MAG: hypothetical protein ACFFB3_00300 [Candidatus Hodarchaeota archaeon]
MKTPEVEDRLVDIKEGEMFDVHTNVFMIFILLKHYTGVYTMQVPAQQSTS